jgi:hypothetical protein
MEGRRPGSGLRRAAAVLALGLAAAGCASVPKEAADLSAEVTGRLDALRDAHLALLRRWADEREARARLFFETVWIPEFMGNLRADPAFGETWKRILGETDAAKQAGMAATAGVKVQGRIDAAWSRIRDGVHALEAGLERGLREEYARARGASEAVTGLLSSAAEATAARDRVLAAAGAGDRIDDAMGKADAVLGRLVEARDRAVSGEERVKEFLGALDGWRAEFGR